MGHSVFSMTGYFGKRCERRCIFRLCVAIDCSYSLVLAGSMSSVRLCRLTRPVPIAQRSWCTVKSSNGTCSLHMLHGRVSTFELILTFVVVVIVDMVVVFILNVDLLITTNIILFEFRLVQTAVYL